MEKKGFDLVDITPHCEFKRGLSGWCNGFNEPNQEIYHVQVWYRDENIAVIHLNGNSYVIDDDLYVLFIDSREGDFIIYRKVKL